MWMSDDKPYYNFNHEAVLKKFNGSRFVAEMTLKASNGHWYDAPFAVYQRDNPVEDEEEFFLLGTDGDSKLMGQIDKERFDSLFRFQDGILCLQCDQAIYSKHRHDNKECMCKNANVDGGRDYFRYGAKDFNNIGLIVIDLLTKTSTTATKVQQPLEGQ